MTLQPAVLVTGGAGFIGSHACKALAAAGFLPVAYDDLSSGHVDAVKWGPLEQGDIRDPRRLAEVLTLHRPAAALHFAARIEAGASMLDPAAFYSVNVTGTLALLQALQASGIRYCIFSSSAAVYGAASAPLIRESHELRPVSPYGSTKLVAEQMLADFAGAHGSCFAALRYFNAAGADPDGQLGERHDPETHLIPLVLQAAARQRELVSVYGVDYPTPDGTCIRDYTHVSDLATAHVLALRHLMNGGPSLKLNLGTGHGASVRQVITASRTVTGREIPTQDHARRPGDPACLVADPSEAKRVLRWQPLHADITTQIRDAWRWMTGERGKAL